MSEPAPELDWTRIEAKMVGRNRKWLIYSYPQLRGKRGMRGLRGIREGEGQPFDEVQLRSCLVSCLVSCLMSLHPKTGWSSVPFISWQKVSYKKALH
jgi:hypothetical protein